MQIGLKHVEGVSWYQALVLTKGFTTPTLGRVIRQDLSNPANFLSKTSLAQVLDQSPREDALGSPSH